VLAGSCIWVTERGAERLKLYKGFRLATRGEKQGVGAR
jgi:hypothetical protein